jgi:hypothetical protein
MTSKLGVATSENILNFHALSTGDNDSSGLSEEEIVAVTAMQAAITLTAKTRTRDWYHMDPNNPETYKDPAWWHAFSDAVTEGDLSFASVSSGLDRQPVLHTINGLSGNIATQLRSIMQEYIPNASDDQLATMIDIFEGSVSPGTNQCLDSWSNNWNTSLACTVFGFGPAWRETGGAEILTKISTDISFFAISVGHADWKQIFVSKGPSQLNIYVGKYRVEFYMGVYNFYKKTVENILGGNPTDRVQKAPFA